MKTKRKYTKRKNVKQATETKEIHADQVDASSPLYQNCVFNQIDTAFIGDPKMMSGIKTVGQSQASEEQVDVVKKQMVDYISSTTSFSPEMVERVLEQAENFMKNRFNLE